MDATPRNATIGTITSGGVLGDMEFSEERITRNWNELLQEIRVVQTGCQILTGFLLTIPFSPRFPELDTLQTRSYLVVLCGSVLTTALVVAPVAFHRALFRQRQRPWLVAAGNVSAKAGLVCLALTSCGVLFLVFDVVGERTVAFWVLGIALLAFATLWALLPWLRGREVNSG